MHTQQMISIHPDVRGRVSGALIRCIEECYDCAQACTSCADSCLAQGGVGELRQCIRLNLDCADVCMATANVATRRTASNEEFLRQMLEACATACWTCGEECERHADQHEFCRVCAETCRSCAEACQQAMPSVH